MSEYFPKPKCLRANLKVELDLSNYATKAELKNTTGVDTSDFGKKTDLANLKSDVGKLDIDKLKAKVDQLDIGKLENTPVDLSKLSNVVKNYVVKITKCNELVKKVKNIKTTDTSDLVKKLTITQKLMKLKIKLLLIMIMLNILLLKNLIN